MAKPQPRPIFYILIFLKLDDIIVVFHPPKLDSVEVIMSVFYSTCTHVHNQEDVIRTVSVVSLSQANFLTPRLSL